MVISVIIDVDLSLRLWGIAVRWHYGCESNLILIVMVDVLLVLVNVIFGVFKVSGFRRICTPIARLAVYDRGVIIFLRLFFFYVERI